MSRRRDARGGHRLLVDARHPRRGQQRPRRRGVRGRQRLHPRRRVGRRRRRPRPASSTRSPRSSPCPVPPRLAPTSADLAAAAAVMPPDIERVLLNPDRTATQINLRLAPASLDERAVLVKELEGDLEARIAELDLAEDSILRVGLQRRRATDPCRPGRARRRRRRPAREPVGQPGRAHLPRARAGRAVAPDPLPQPGPGAARARPDRPRRRARPRSWSARSG